MKLGRLKKIDPRSAWITEDRHFTPWLASDDNIELLSESLGLDLVVEAQEKQVGPFRADILCKDTQSDAYVLIENQLEKTDHKHLGQVITYASGLKTAYIIWIATKFHEEHRAAMDWLNAISDDNFKFFGLEVELWAIGDSEFAPKFNIVSKPNEWSRTANAGLRNVEQGTSDLKLQQKAFWDQFSSYVFETHGIRPQKARAQHWLNITVGKTGVKIACTLNTRLSQIGVELYMHQEDAKEIFFALLQHKSAIETELGLTLDWQELPEKTATRIAIYRQQSPLSDEESWADYNHWMGSVCDGFNRVFRKWLQEV